MSDPSTPTKGIKSKFDATGVPTRLGRYKLEKLLGRGGMAGVYLATDDQGKQVAVKVLAPGESEDPVGVERFHLEAELMSKLEHRNIVKVFEFSRAEGRTFLATEYIDGGTVRELSRQMGPIPASLAAEIIAQLLTGLSAAHAEGIVHRDLKPENMLLTRTGVMKLVDFGIARLQGQTRLTSTGTVLGTVQYMSPEQAAANDIDARSDIFSAGTILFELLAGLNPFEGDTAVVSLSRVMSGLQTPVSELAPATPPQLEAILERMLAVDLKVRYPSALAVLADLDPVLAGARERAPNLLADCVARPVEIGVALRAGAARALIADARKLSEGSNADKMLAAIKLHGAQVTHPQAGEATELLNRLSQALHLNFGPSKNPKVAELEKQLIGKPPTTAVLIQLAQLYRLEGNVLAAARFYKRALRLKPTDGYIAGLLLQLTGERMGHASDDDDDKPTQMVPKAMLQNVPVLATAAPTVGTLPPIVTGSALAVEPPSAALAPPPKELAAPIPAATVPAARGIASPPPAAPLAPLPDDVFQPEKDVATAVESSPLQGEPRPVVVGLDGEGKGVPTFDDESTGPLGLTGTPGWAAAAAANKGPTGPVPSPPRASSAFRPPPGVLHRPDPDTGPIAPPSGTATTAPAQTPSSTSGFNRSPLPLGHVPAPRSSPSAPGRTPSGFFPTVPPSGPLPAPSGPPSQGSAAPSPVPSAPPRSSGSSPPMLAPQTPGANRTPSGFYAAPSVAAPRGTSGFNPPVPPSDISAAMIRSSSPGLPIINPARPQSPPGPAAGSGSHPVDLDFNSHSGLVLEEVSGGDIVASTPAPETALSRAAAMAASAAAPPAPLPPPDSGDGTATREAPRGADAEALGQSKLPPTDPVGVPPSLDHPQDATRPLLKGGAAAAPPASTSNPLLPPKYSPTGTPQNPLPRRKHRRRQSSNTLLTLVALAVLVAVCFDIGLRLRRPPPAAPPPTPVEPLPPPPGNTLARAAVDDARKLWREGNADKAILALQAVAAQYPDTPEAGEALLQIADINLVRAQPRDARFSLDAFLKAAPGHARAAEAYLRRGQVEEELNDLPAAEADYREVLKSYEGSLLLPDAHLRLGLLLKKRGKVKEARDELGVALRQSRAGDNVNRQAFDALLKLQKQ